MAAIALAPAGAALCTGPQAIACGILGGIVLLGAGAYMLIQNADDDAEENLSSTKDETCTTCCKRTVVISRAASPLTAQHIADAQASGHPSILTYDPPGRSARRRAALSGIPTRPGMDRDEYPPAVFAEGGAGASVRHIPLADNRSAGGQMSAQLAGATQGCTITMTVGP